MNFQEKKDFIKWKIHLKSSPDKVYKMLDSDEGRAKFWAESARETDGYIHFIFPNGEQWRAQRLKKIENYLFSIRYIGFSKTTFKLKADGNGGTDLILLDQKIVPDLRCEVISGWVSVLLALKAAVDFDIDIRNHDRKRTWANGYAEN